MESAALLGFPHLGSLGKRIKLALANSLMHYLPSTQPFERNVAKGKSMDRPHRLHPVGTTRSPQGRLRHPGVTDRPYTLFNKWNTLAVRSPVGQSGWAVRVGEGQSLVLKTGIRKTKQSGEKRERALPSWFSCNWILRNHKNPGNEIPTQHLLGF